MHTSSRFSVLNPDVSLDTAFRTKSSKPKSSVPKENKPEIKNVKPISKVVKKKKNDEIDLQAMAFGRTKGGKKSASSKQNSAKTKDKKSKGAKTSNETLIIDEQWKKIDEEFIEKENETALREAIIQSKLEFEEKKKKKIEKCEEEKEKLSKITKVKKRKEKPITLSLDQFNSLDPKQLANLRDPTSINEKPNNEPIQNGLLQKFDDEKFFKDVEELTKKTLEKEKRQEQYKINANRLNNEIQVKKFKSEIEKRDFEIQALRLEVESLRTLLFDVKSRNKKLCDVISCSEMRSKGELVVELDKMTKCRDEFSEEVTRLNMELEKERTKVSHLTNDLKKMQGKKRNADSSGK